MCRPAESRENKVAALCFTGQKSRCFSFNGTNLPAPRLIQRNFRLFAFRPAAFPGAARKGVHVCGPFLIRLCVSRVSARQRFLLGPSSSRSSRAHPIRPIRRHRWSKNNLGSVQRSGGLGHTHARTAPFDNRAKCPKHAHAAVHEPSLWIVLGIKG